MSPEEADAEGLKPFGDGGADDAADARPKLYTHGPCCTQASRAFVVDCRGWQALPDAAQRELAAQGLAVLRSRGFVVLEGLFRSEDVALLEGEAGQFLETLPEGFVPQPLRAERQEIQLPFAPPWGGDWLTGNELVLEIAAGYIRNNLAAGRTQDEQQEYLVQWLTSGAELDWFRGQEWQPKPGPLLEDPPDGCSSVGSPGEAGPWLGRVTLIRTPRASPPQKHHRDINFPGPTAQLTVQVPLTPLVANNGPLSYTPGSHRMETPGYEVIANPPPGSAVLYDSFTEHRGTENHTPNDRYAMYYEFETRGIFHGYTDEHFGAPSADHSTAFRLAVDPALRALAAAEEDVL